MTLTDHYYSNKPQVESNPKLWDFTLEDVLFVLKADTGVFRKVK